jgi:TP901 family phage tail tape measure protein
VAESVLSFLLLGKDMGASAALGKVGVAAGEASAAMGKVGVTSTNMGARSVAAFNKIGAASALAVVGVAAYGVKAAAELDRLTMVYVTAAGEQEKNLGKIKDGILQIAGDTGTSWEQVAEGMYTAEKAGITYAKGGLDVVKASAQAAKEENADLATTVNAVTSIMASYHLSAKDSVPVANQLKTLAGESKATFQQVAGSLSTVLPLASAANVSFADLGGNFATMTQHGTSADEVTQELAFAIRNLHAPNQVAQKEMAQLGISAVDVSTKMGDGPGGRGLAGTLNYLSKTVLEKMGSSGTLLLDTFNKSQAAANSANTMFKALPPEAQKLAAEFQANTISTTAFTKSAKGLTGQQGQLALQWRNTYSTAHGFQQLIKNGVGGAQTYTQALKAMLGGANGLNVALQTTGESTEATTERINRLKDASRTGGKDVEGWAKTQSLLSTQLAQFGQRAQAAAIKIGQTLLPVLSSMMKFLSDHPVVIKLAVGAIATLAAAWAATKLYSVAAGVVRITTALYGMATASRIAATANAAGGASAAAGAASRVIPWGTAAAGGVGAAGAAGAGAAVGRGAAIRSAAVRMVIPLAVTYVALKASGNDKVITNLVKGDFDAAMKSVPQWEQDLSTKIRGMFGAKTDAGPLSGAMGAGLKNKLDVGGVEHQIDGLQAKMRGLFNEGKTGSPAFAALLRQVGDLNVKLGQTERAPAMAASKRAADAFGSALSGLGARVDVTSHALTGNTEVANANRAAITDLVGKARDSAIAYANSTGVATDYNRVLALGIPQILAQASALGLNKSQVDRLIGSILAIPPSKSTTITAPGLAENLSLMQAYLGTLNNIAKPVVTSVTTYKQDVQLGKMTTLAGAAMGYGGPTGGSASGTFSTPAGLRWVGERGPELLRLPAGSQVINHSRSQAMAGGGGVTVNLNVSTINASSFQGELRKGNLAQLLGAEIAKATSNR